MAVNIRKVKNQDNGAVRVSFTFDSLDDLTAIRDHMVATVDTRPSINTKTFISALEDALLAAHDETPD
jgi:hypothetical protein